MKKILFIFAMILTWSVVAEESIKWNDLQKNIDNWLEGPVSLIMTGEEKEIFKKLQTPEEKMQFIKIFWARRDPILRTVENEYKEEFYRRVKEANRKFAEGKTPGWQTARGQVYIVLGAPSRVDTQIVAESSRPAQLWVYDKIPSNEIPKNEALMFVFRDFKYVLVPPNPQPGDKIGEERRAIEATFRYQTIPSTVRQAFADVAEQTVVDKSKNYQSLVASVRTTEKFGIGGIHFEVRSLLTHPPKFTIVIPVEKAPIYDDGERRFAEFVVRQQLKKGEEIIASHEHTVTFSWDETRFSQLQEITISLPALQGVPPGEYELAITVQDRISRVSETKSFPANY